MAEKRLIRVGGVFGEVFGYPVIEVEGPFSDDFSKLKWRFTDHRDGETAEFRVCGIEAYVQDCDGDYSLWSVKRGRAVIAEGNERDFFPALAKAEAALRSYARQRIRESKASDGPFGPLANHSVAAEG